MSVIKAIVSVFSEGQEKPIERYKSLLSDEHKESLNAFEKHLSDFLGLKDKMRTLGLGQYTLKQYLISKCDGKVDNFDILACVAAGPRTRLNPLYSPSAN